MPLPAGLPVSAVTPQVVYLHGFASSPASSKAAFLKGRFADRGIAFHCPDLNRPDFSTVTASRMMEHTASLIAVADRRARGAVRVEPRCVRGAAGRRADPNGDQPSITQLVLLAPALDFGRRPVGDLGEAGMARWRDTGWWELTHHASGEPTRVHYELFRDARRYDSFAAQRPVPTLVLQGRRDNVVDPDMVSRYATARPHVTLVMLDDDHQLGASLERVWSESAGFLGLRE